MLIFDTLQIFSTTSSGSTVTLRANLFVEGFCTDFDHDASQESFDGQAIFVAAQMVERIVGASTVEFTGPLFTLPMTVVKSGFDTAASTGACIMTGSIGSPPGVLVTIGSGVTMTHFPLTGISGVLTLSPMAVGFSVIAGSILGELGFGPAGETHFSRTVNEHPFSLTAGCPI